MKLLRKFEMDLIIKSREDYKEAVLDLLDKDESAKLLDLGCGESGRLPDRISSRVHPEEYHGVDIRWTSPMERMRLYQADLNGPLPTASSYFDVVVASQVLEHLWNTDGFLKEIYRCLKPTGYAIISTPNLASWHNVLFLLLGRQPPCMANGDMYPEKEKPGHLKVFTVSELLKTLRFHGFKVDKIIKTFGNVTVKVTK